MYKVIIFDFDGTLCSSIATTYESMCRTFDHFGRKKPSLADVSNMCKQSPNLIDSFLLLDPSLRDYDLSELDTLCDYYRNVYASTDVSKLKLYPEVQTVLQTIQQAGILCLVVSNKSAMSINRSLQSLNCTHFFDHIYGESSRFPPKPDPRLFTHEIAPSYPDFSLSDFLMVGDTAVDFYFAERSKIDMAWVDYGYGDIDEIDVSRLKFQLQQPLDLITALGL